MKSNINDIPIVSVVMITYNHGNFLKDAINGVLMQEVDFSIELIIGDDCSTDNAQNVVESFIGHKNYDWIKYTRHTTNLGMMPNFIWALNQAEGEFIALCEGDDYWTDPLKLRKQYDFLAASSNYDMVYTDIDFLYDSPEVHVPSVYKCGHILNKNDYIANVVSPTYFSAPTWFIRAGKLKNVVFLPNTTDGTYEILLYFLRNSKVAYIEDSTAVYRILRESATRSKDINKVYLWWLGIFNIQKHHLKHHIKDDNIATIVYINQYTYILKNYAFALLDQEFIDEACAFFRKKNLWYLYEAMLSDYVYSQVKLGKLYRFLKLITYITRLFPNIKRK